MSRLLQRTWQRVVRRVGYPGVLALALLVPTAIIALWMPQLSRHADELRAALVAQADAVARQSQPVRRRMSNGEQVLEFVAAFPPLAQSSSDLDEVFAFAKHRNVTLLKGEYQLKLEPSTPLVSFTATFPVRNEYGALKDFTADVLKALPHVSMDELRLTRTDTGSGVLDSVVRFTFIYRNL
jgi:hypothetical protein